MSRLNRQNMMGKRSMRIPKSWTSGSRESHMNHLTLFLSALLVRIYCVGWSGCSGSSLACLCLHRSHHRSFVRNHFEVLCHWCQQLYFDVAGVRPRLRHRGRRLEVLTVGIDVWSYLELVVEVRMWIGQVLEHNPSSHMGLRSGQRCCVQVTRRLRRRVHSHIQKSWLGLDSVNLGEW